MSWVVVGLASRTGSNDLNWKLAKKRAEAVSSQIWFLDSMMRGTIETRFGVGEQAAWLAGLKDGVEDERWRSAFVWLCDPAQIKVFGPPQRQPLKIERRTYVKYLFDDKAPKNLPDLDGGEKYMRMGRALGMYLVDDLVPQDEKKVEIWDNYTVTKVEFWTTTNKGAWETTYLEVRYTWEPAGPNATRRVVERNAAGAVLQTRPMSNDEMNLWVNHPLRAYIKKGLLPSKGG